MINVTVKNDKGEIVFNCGYTNHKKALQVFFEKTGKKHLPLIEEVINCSRYHFDNVTARFVR